MDSATGDHDSQRASDFSVRALIADLDWPPLALRESSARNSPAKAAARLGSQDGGARPRIDSHER
jgi:hypothetical protein